MASSSMPKVMTFQAGAAIPKGSAVKFGADEKHVVKASAVSDKIIGIAQNAVDTAEDLVEVALPGGGGKGLAGGSISKGDLLTTDANGALVVASTANDRVCGMAMVDAVSADIFGLEVLASNF